MKSQMVIYVPFVDKLHCECDQNAGNGFAKLKKNATGVCVGGGGGGGGGCPFLQPARFPPLPPTHTHILNIPI